MKNKIFGYLLISILILYFINFAPAGELDHYAKINNTVSLFYQDSGKGQVILFIPGWTMSSEIFKYQIAYFSKKYRVIALDPRSQGRSTVTLNNNTYSQHGTDLANFIDHLKLHKIILVAWSWGCNDAYAYIRLKGIDNLKAFVCIDSSPKPSGNQHEWAITDYSNWGAAVIQPFKNNRLQFTRNWVQSVVDHKITSNQLNWIIGQSLMTPTFAATQLLLDAIYADYRPEVRLLNNHNIPTLDFVSKNSANNAKQWLHTNAPNAEIEVINKHLMFWEHPEEFNRLLNAFIKQSVGS